MFTLSDCNNSVAFESNLSSVENCNDTSLNSDLDSSLEVLHSNDKSFCFTGTSYSSDFSVKASVSDTDKKLPYLNSSTSYNSKANYVDKNTSDLIEFGSSQLEDINQSPDLFEDENESCIKSNDNFVDSLVSNDSPDCASTDLDSSSLLDHSSSESTSSSDLECTVEKSIEGTHNVSETCRNRNSRKKIRKIIKNSNLNTSTIAALKAEFERRKWLKSLKTADDSPTEIKRMRKNSDVIALSEDESMEEFVKDDDVICLEDPESIEEDELASLEKQIGSERVLLNYNHPASDKDVYLPPKMGLNVKVHQLSGMRFLYDNIIETFERSRNTSGFGCILAHSMGLGKTFQVIGFSHAILKESLFKRILIIVPINTIQNWYMECKMWLEFENNTDCTTSGVNIFKLGDNCRRNLERITVLEKWFDGGGILLLGYEMFRLLTLLTPGKLRKPSKRTLDDAMGDSEDSEFLQTKVNLIKRCLIKPGADIIICDEGHRIKNSGASISKVLKSIETKRRVVLTGYPLQNNLLEYWCMVDFVKPNYLGTKHEFINMFDRPIQNGQCSDSTPEDLKLMRYRTHVLCSRLANFVQRRSHSVILRVLPPKVEYVIHINLSSFQRKLYDSFINFYKPPLEWGSPIASLNPIKAYSSLCKIWNHPDVLYYFLKKRVSDSDNNDLHHEHQMSYEWAESFFQDYTSDQLELGPKMMILFEIITSTVAAGEKLLIFSQSLSSLSCIERHLQKLPINSNSPDCWQKDRDYFRLDGETGASDRDKMVRDFNEVTSSKKIFLLSTRAGCLGINLVGANRVVVLDVSWNPCHDVQAVCRVYRYGQTKPTFVYRLVASATMERRMLDRQTSKQNMSDRVVDKLNPDSVLSRKDVESLFHIAPEEQDFSKEKSKQFSDHIMRSICEKHANHLAKTPTQHESLLLNQKDERLSRREQQEAQENYQRELQQMRPSPDRSLSRGTSEIILPNDIIIPAINTQYGQDIRLYAGDRVTTYEVGTRRFLRTKTGHVLPIAPNHGNEHSIRILPPLSNRGPSLFSRNHYPHFNRQPLIPRLSPSPLASMSMLANSDCLMPPQLHSNNPHLSSLFDAGMSSQNFQNFEKPVPNPIAFLSSGSYNINSIPPSPQSTKTHAPEVIDICSDTD